MSKVKLLLDVVEDMRNLADSIQAVADGIRYSLNAVRQGAHIPSHIEEQFDLTQPLHLLPGLP